MSTISLKTGNLRLQLHRKEDVFHSEDISSTELLPVYETFIGIPFIGFGQGTFYASGAKPESQIVEIDAKDTIVGGFYEDSLNIFNPYEVRIHIIYEIEE